MVELAVDLGKRCYQGASWHSGCVDDLFQLLDKAVLGEFSRVLPDFYLRI